MALSTREYDVIERAVAGGTRIAVTRRGTQWIVVADALTIDGRRERLDARRPSSGERMSWYIDELERVEAVR